MPAPKGNKNAEKWNEKTVLPKLTEIEKVATRRNKPCSYLTEALVEVGLYKDIWAEWKRKFKDNSIVYRSIKRIDSIFEVKLVKGALNGDHNPSVSIFLMKNNHGMTDKQETTLKGSDDAIQIHFHVDED